jgi:acetylornithine/succinyldiaminopimelate/putrescine aminotransferase
MTSEPSSSAFRGLYDTRTELQRDYDAHLLPSKARFYDAIGVNLTVGRREGVWFEDAHSGRRFINCHCNGGVFNLGHRNPEVVAAVRQALDSADIGNHHFVSGVRTRLATRLSATTGDRLARVVFAVAGGEAADVALKVARGATKRPGIVSAQGGYHGHTGLALATGDGAYRDLFGPNLPGFTQVPFNDVQAIESTVDDRTAAVILEAIPATLGMVVPEPGYLGAVRRICTERGALLIIDEIQTGLGRTGRMWSYLHEGIVPDAVLTGKALSGGVYPIAAALMTEQMHGILLKNPFLHFSTFGGAELGCVAALAVLDIVERAGFLDRVNALSARFAEQLSGLPFVLRRRGLFMGLKLPSEADALRAFMRLLDAGVFLFPAGNDRAVLQFLPPLIISDEEVDDLVIRMRRALE